MTDQEMLAMQGTEFTYFFEDGDSIEAYVKRVDLEEYKMTCWSLGFETKEGYVFDPINEDERKEGALCVLIGDKDIPFEHVLKEIKETGMYKPKNKEGGCFFPGCPF